MADKKASKKVVDDKTAVKAKAPEAKEEDYEFVKISGETYKKYADGRMLHAGN